MEAVRLRIPTYEAVMEGMAKGMEVVIKVLRKEGIRDKVRVIVGGAPLNEVYARKIGADAYARGAVTGMNIVKEWAIEFSKNN